MNLGELIAEFRSRTGDDVSARYRFSDELVTGFANQAESEAAIRASLLFDTGSITLTPNVKRYALDSLIWKIDSAIITDPTVLDSELLTTDGWATTAGWTESPDDVFAHTAGITTITHSAAIDVGVKYRLSWTVTNRTTGSFIVSIGGQSKSTIYTSGTVDMTTTTGDAFTITPTTDFDGTISLVSVKRIVSENIKSILDLTDRSTLDAKFPDWRIATSGKPKYIIVDEASYDVYPTPDKAYTLTLDYYRTPIDAMYDSSSEPEINSRHHDGLVDWMVRQAMQVKDIDASDITLSPDAEAKFINRFGIRRDANIMRKQARKGAHTVKAIRF